jgi:hypothetical protein
MELGRFGNYELLLKRPCKTTVFPCAHAAVLSSITDATVTCDRWQ